MVALTPKVLAKNGFSLGDIVDVTIQHIKEDKSIFRAEDELFMKLAYKKMRREGIDFLPIRIENGNTETETKTK